jgi:hypothetical protein
MLIYDKTGAVAIVLGAGDRPKSVEHPMTPVGPSFAYYGDYTLDGKNMTIHVKGSTYPNFEGSEQKAIVTLNGDSLTLVRPIKTAKETFTSTLEFQRVK